MRVNREKLIEQLKERVIEMEARAEAKFIKDQSDEQARETAYVVKTGEHWAKLVQRIQRRVKAGEPVLATDLPDDLRQGGYLGFRPAKVERQRPQLGELTRLIALLEASPDETVSIPSLERAGFTLGKVLK